MTAGFYSDNGKFDEWGSNTGFWHRIIPFCKADRAYGDQGSQGHEFSEEPTRLIARLHSDFSTSRVPIPPNTDIGIKLTTTSDAFRVFTKDKHMTYHVKILSIRLHVPVAAMVIH